MRKMLILASQSPRRRELLTAAGIRFAVRVSAVPEVRGVQERPRDYVQRLAREKAMAVRRPGELVLGADTTVVLDDHVLEKPDEAADAARMMRLLSGRKHQVLTGICLLSPQGETISDVAQTDVYFRDLSEQEIATYVDSGEPMDKAGGYGIQGLASRFIERIDGDYCNVVGLPVSLVYRHLRTLIAAGAIGDL